MGLPKKQRTQEYFAKAEKAAVVEAGSWNGFPICLVVPWSKGRPSEVVEAFLTEMEEMRERANLVNIRDMYEASFNIQESIENELSGQKPVREVN